MVEIGDDEWDLISEALQIWIGVGRRSYPSTDDDLVLETYGPIIGTRLIEVLAYLVSEFFSSDASSTIGDLNELTRVASLQFRARFPNINPSGISALEWLYSYSNR